MWINKLDTYIVAGVTVALKNEEQSAEALDGPGLALLAMTARRHYVKVSNVLVNRMSCIDALSAAMYTTAGKNSTYVVASTGRDNLRSRKRCGHRNQEERSHRKVLLLKH